MFSLCCPTWISSFPFMYGNYCHFSKRSQMLHLLHILIVKQCESGFVLSGLTIILSKFVAVKVTSHQNSPFSLALMPACINIALALPTSVGIFFSTTEFCWGVAGAKFKNRTQILFVTFVLETSVFSTVVKPYSWNLNSIFSGHSLYPHWYHSIWSLFLLIKICDCNH